MAYIIETLSNTLIQGCVNTVIPNTVTSIGNNGFCGCVSLTNIEIPSGVTSLGRSAFTSCRNLTSITSNAMKAPMIQFPTFQEVKRGGTLYVPLGSSGYNTWMQNSVYYLGYYNWTKVEQ